MTREEAKIILTSILHTDGAYMDYLDSEDVEAIKVLANEERPHGEWIPCSERLPEKNGRYLASWVSNLTNRYYIDSIFFAYGEWDCCNGDVEAWMPLPEPYKEEGD